MLVDQAAGCVEVGPGRGEIVAEKKPGAGEQDVRLVQRRGNAAVTS